MINSAASRRMAATRQQPHLCVLAARVARALPIVSPSQVRGRREGRVAACTRALAQKENCASATTTGTGGDHTGLPCAMVYGLYVISPVNLADCHRPRRDAKHRRQVSASLWGARTTRFRRPPPCRTSGSTFASTAFRSAFVTTRNAPLQSERNGDSKAQNSEKRKRNIFAPRAGQSADYCDRKKRSDLPAGQRRHIRSAADPRSPGPACRNLSGSASAAEQIRSGRRSVSLGACTT